MYRAQKKMPETASYLGDPPATHPSFARMVMARSVGRDNGAANGLARPSRQFIPSYAVRHSMAAASGSKQTK